MAESFDLIAHLTRQMAWSKATFGPGARTEGVLDHMTKEIAEVREARGDPNEWVDLVILALDGLTRSLWAECQYNRAAHRVAREAVQMILSKQGRNELRTWPDWRTSDPNKAIEHDRSKDELHNCPHCNQRHYADEICP